MIAWLMGLGLSQRAAKLLVIVGGTLLVLAAFYIALTAYGHARYKQGKADADAAWIAASNKLIQQAQSSASKADKAAAARQADFAAKQEDERKRIDAAQKQGDSPLDVLFGNSAQ